MFGVWQIFQSVVQSYYSQSETHWLQTLFMWAMRTLFSTQSWPEAPHRHEPSPPLTDIELNQTTSLHMWTFTDMIFNSCKCDQLLIHLTFQCTVMRKVLKPAWNCTDLRRVFKVPFVAQNTFGENSIPCVVKLQRLYNASSEDQQQNWIKCATGKWLRWQDHGNLKIIFHQQQASTLLSSPYNLFHLHGELF